MRFIVFAALWSLPLSAQITGGMLDPAIDPADRPFSYFWKPDDVLGALYAPLASEVTPEGYIWTGFGELMFFTGNPPEPVNQRLRTLRNGYLPVIGYDVARNGVRYRFRLFAADLGGALAGLPVNFAGVEISNQTKEPRAAFLTSAFRVEPPVTAFPSPPEYRFFQRWDLLPQSISGGRAGGGTPPARGPWKYSFAGDALLRDGHVIYMFPPDPWQRSLAIGDRGLRMVRYFSGEVEGDRDPKLTPNRQTPMGAATWRVVLAPGASRTLWFRMPVAPSLAEGSAEALQLAQADPAREMERIAAEWDRLVVRPAPLHFPETKVQEYLLANTIVNLIAMDRIGDDYIVNVNKFHYHRPYGGANVVNMIRGYEYMGLLDIARRALLYRLKVQHEDGSFRMEHYPDRPYWEMFGYNLWGWARHYELTRDREFLRQVYPGVGKAMAWLGGVTARDPLGLMPRSTINDDAMLSNTRQTGQHMWVMIGMLACVDMARAMGDQAAEQRYREQYARFRAAFDAQLAVQTAKTGGYIPPGLERTTRGNDWDNLLTLYPAPLFEPFDPRVTATLRKARGEYVEGVLRYVTPRAIARRGDDFLYDETPTTHYWQTPDNAMASLIRGAADDQQWAVRELYALLLHTSSTHLPGEFGTAPWSTRVTSSQHNILPQGATSSKTIELLRHMLVREQGDDLYLYSALSPEWLQPGKTIRVEREPSAFGPVDASLNATAAGFTVALGAKFRNPPKRIFVRIPWFFQATSATADGRAVPLSGGALQVAPGVRSVQVQGHIRADAPRLSYARAVEDYKSEYRRRYRKFLQTGEIEP
jgi:hypothetical protein